MMIKSTEKIREVVRSFTKFSFVGVISMLIDQGLFAILVNFVFAFCEVEKAIVISTIIARICSSIFNYLMNRNVVFKSSAGFASVVRYYILCIVQMLTSAMGVMVLYIITKGNTTILKLFVDLMLFFLSYQIQKRWVFINDK